MSQRLRSNKSSTSALMTLLPYVALALVCAAMLRLMFLYVDYTTMSPPTYLSSASPQAPVVYQYLLAAVYAAITVAITTALRPITTLLADLHALSTEALTSVRMQNITNLY